MVWVLFGVMCMLWVMLSDLDSSMLIRNMFSLKWVSSMFVILVG